MKQKNKLGKFNKGIGLAMMILTTISIHLWADDGSSTNLPSAADGVNGVTAPANGTPRISTLGDKGHYLNGSNNQETGDTSSIAGTQNGSGGGSTSLCGAVTYQVTQPSTGIATAGSTVDILVSYPTTMTSVAITGVRYVPTPGSTVNSVDITSSAINTGLDRCLPGGPLPPANTGGCFEIGSWPAGMVASSGGGLGIGVIYFPTIDTSCMDQSAYQTYGVNAALVVN